MQGSGKTLYLVKKAYESYLKGKIVYSNVNLHFPFKQLDYNDIVECNLENAIVIIDEGHQLLPSRKSLSAINISIVDGFLSMVRKKGLELYFSTQTERKIDVRVREESDYKYLCEKWAFIKGKWSHVTESEDLDISIPIIISVMIYQSFSGAIIQTSFSGNPYFRLFDTKQIIKVRGIK
jgi:hypothetical protein